MSDKVRQSGKGTAVEAKPRTWQLSPVAAPDKVGRNEACTLRKGQCSQEASTGRPESEAKTTQCHVYCRNGNFGRLGTTARERRYVLAPPALWRRGRKLSLGKLNMFLYRAEDKTGNSRRYYAVKCCKRMWHMEARHPSLWGQMRRTWPAFRWLCD